MLNLVTGQVTTKTSVNVSIYSRTTFGTLLHHSIAASLHSEIHTRTIDGITEKEFILDLHENENYYCLENHVLCPSHRDLQYHPRTARNHLSSPYKLLCHTGP